MGVLIEVSRELPCPCFQVPLRHQALRSFQRNPIHQWLQQLQAVPPLHDMRACTCAYVFQCLEKRMAHSSSWNNHIWWLLFLQESQAAALAQSYQISGHVQPFRIVWTVEVLPRWGRLPLEVCRKKAHWECWEQSLLEAPKKVKVWLTRIYTKWYVTSSDILEKETNGMKNITTCNVSFCKNSTYWWRWDIIRWKEVEHLER